MMLQDKSSPYRHTRSSSVAIAWSLPVQQYVEEFPDFDPTHFKINLPWLKICFDGKTLKVFRVPEYWTIAYREHGGGGYIWKPTNHRIDIHFEEGGWFIAAQPPKKLEQDLIQTWEKTKEQPTHLIGKLREHGHHLIVVMQYTTMAAS